MSRKRLVCIVEGYGDVLAFPNLCSRVRDYLCAWDWYVDPQPVRQPRAQIVDESLKSPRRPARAAGVAKAMELALGRPADAVVLTCDADDDCPAVWGPSASTLLGARCNGAAVMVSREFEAWLLYAFSDQERKQLGIGSPDAIRDAKGKLKLLWPRYKPTTHQLEITRKVNIESLWQRSDSFDKLMRSLMKIFAVEDRVRPV